MNLCQSWTMLHIDMRYDHSQCTYTPSYVNNRLLFVIKGRARVANLLSFCCLVTYAVYLFVLFYL